MWELAVVILGSGGVGWIAHWLFQRNRQQTTTPQLEKVEKTEKYASLFAIRGGVRILEPNGSEHIIQAKVEQELARHGMALRTLRREPVEVLLKEGEWPPTIASGPIDVAVVGRIIIQTYEGEEVEYPTIRHIDTSTGIPFYGLFLADHPRGKHWDCGCNEVLGGGFHYHEPEEEYQWRREQEKKTYPVTKQRARLDVRFYGPDGIVRGGCSAEAPENEKKPLEWLVEALVRDLAEVADQSLAAHAKALAEGELRALSGGS